MWHENRLTDEQIRLVEGWLDAPVLVKDLSWGLLDTVVLHIQAEQGAFVVKAAGPANHHIGREISSHERFTAPLIELTAAARLIGASREANTLVTEFLGGQLVEGTPDEFESETYLQAGRLLGVFHAQTTRIEHDFERSASERALA